MKTKFFFILISILSFASCRSQIVESISLTDYPNFYNQTVNKLNNIIPNKTSYYNQPLSVFLETLTQNNLVIKAYNPGPFDNNFLKLMFINDAESSSNIWRNNYVEPHIEITFQQSFDYQQASTILNQYHWFWNASAENFYKGLIVKKIEFWYVNGITDMSNNPK